MLQLKEAAGSVNDPSGDPDRRSAAGRGPLRFLPTWIPYALLPCAILGAAAATVFSPSDLTNGVHKFSNGLKSLWLTAQSRPGSGPISHHPAARHTGDPPVPAAAKANVEGGEIVSFGDRLKVTFFETTGVDLATGEAVPDRAITVMFPRMDLSADYTVDESGSLELPKLGRVATSGKSVAALQSELATTFQRALGKPADVHVAIVDRLPIYVVGAVRAAGSFKYVPGMFVMQAVAGAGGIDRGVSDTSKVIETIRETGRLRLIKSKLDYLLLKEARLLAQKANVEGVSIPPSIASALSQKGSRDRLERLIDAAEASLKAAQKDYRDQVTLSHRHIEVVRLEIAAQEVRIKQLSKLVGKKESKLQELQAIAQRGSIPQHRIMEMEIEIAEQMARREDFNVTLAQTQRRLIEQEAAHAKLERDHYIGVESELFATQQDLHNLLYETTSMQAVIAALENDGGEAPRSGNGPRLSITRRVGGQLVVTPAIDTTVLLPGDVVTVDFAGRSGAALTADVQHPGRSRD